MTSVDPGRTPVGGPSPASGDAADDLPATAAEGTSDQREDAARPLEGDAAVGDDSAAEASGAEASAEETSAEETSAEETSAEDTEQRKSFWRELPILVLVALVLAFLIKTFLVQAFFIPSESMENTLLVGDRVLVNKLAYRFGEVERGDVVVFDGRGSFEPRRPSDGDGNSIGDAFRAVASSFGLAPGTESDYIKRVIGVGGDHVVCCDADGRMTVNDMPLDGEDYLFPGDVPSTNEFDVTVPDGRLWVMGDHRSRSEDSRSHTGGPGGGTVAVDKVIGRAFVKVWPIGRWDTMPRPSVFDDVAAAAPPGSG